MLEQEAGDLAAAQLLLTRLLDIVRLSPPRPEFAQATAALVVSRGATAGLGADMLHVAEAAAQGILSFSSTTEMVRLTAQACLAVIAYIAAMWTPPAASTLRSNRLGARSSTQASWPTGCSDDSQKLWAITAEPVSTLTAP
jgi:hypothetical protein